MVPPNTVVERPSGRTRASELRASPAGSRETARASGALCAFETGSDHSSVHVILCYCDFMKNITVSVPDETYRQARIRAAQLDTSVSALVREFLEGLGGEESEFERRRLLQAEVLAEIGRFRASDRLSRDEVHERDALR